MPNKTNILRFVRVMFSTLFFHMHFSAIVLYLVIYHCCHVHFSAIVLYLVISHCCHVHFSAIVLYLVISHRCHVHFSAIVLYLVISHCCHVHCILCGVSFIILVDVGFIERVYDLNKVKNIYSLFRRNSHYLNYLN